MLRLTVEMTLLVLLVAILAGPILGAKLRIPGLLGLIFLGMLFGPHALGWLGRMDLVFDLGSIGILYLMFLAGLGFNLNAFAENRRSAIGFGLLSFIVPFGLTIGVTISLVEGGILAAALLGSMWASNTLVAYPDVRAAGLDGTRAVRDAVSGGVVADVLSLLVLAFATSHVVIETVDPDTGAVNLQETPSLPLFISVPILVAFALWLLPRIGAWFFVRVGRARVQRVLFALAAMAATAALAVAAGLEGIIGAFLAGIGLNRLVPNNSELMERIDFVGTSVFIPAFLVAIGLRIDPAALVDLETVGIGLIFVGLVVVGKAGAVVVASRFFHYSFDEGGLITSLSVGQAASTLAIGQIGLELGLFGQQVVNASVLAIVITALITSFGTQFFMRRLPAPAATVSVIGERTLVDAHSDDSDLALMVKLAGRIARGDDGIMIPFVVSTRDDKAHGRLRISQAEELALAGGHDCEGIGRLSDSVVDGTLELIDETDATSVVLGWAGPRLGVDNIFGSDVNSVGAGSTVPTLAAHLTRPWDRVVVVPGTSGVSWHFEDAALALTVAERLRGRGPLPLLVIADDRTRVEAHLGPRSEYEFIAAETSGDALIGVLEPGDIVVAPSYLLQTMPIARRLRLSNRLADQNLVMVAGPGRLSAGPSSMFHGTEQILGPQIT